MEKKLPLGSGHDVDRHKCSCGSGLDRIERLDARGIFLTFACERCWPEKSTHWRQDILTDPNYEVDEPIDDDEEDDDDGYLKDEDYFLTEDDEWRASVMVFADPGGKSSLRAVTKDNPRNQPCPNCEEPNKLTPLDVSLGYQCDDCADALEWGIDR
jgi:hypothetical protein